MITQENGMLVVDTPYNPGLAAGMMITLKLTTATQQAEVIAYAEELRKENG